MARCWLIFLAASSAVVTALSAADAQTAQPSAAPVAVYSEDFEKAPGDEWSADKTAATPDAARRFLGEFGNETVALSIRKLPPHKLVTVSIDLLVIRAWKGSHAKWGPDVWKLAVGGGPTLLCATFSNVDFYSACQQSFPDQVGICVYPPRTGAAEKDSLGFVFDRPGEISERVLDAVYHLSFTFPHTAPEISLEFSASGLEQMSVQSWGLDNVSVEVRPAAEPVDEPTLETLWNDLASEDGRVACDAAWALIASGQAAVEFISRNAAGIAADPQRADALIARLDDDDSRSREKATESLVAMGPAAKKPVSVALARLSRDAGMEMRLRLQYILKQIQQKPPLPEEQRRHRRLMHVLAVINSDSSRALLERLPRSGEPGAEDKADKKEDSNHKPPPPAS